MEASNGEDQAERSPEVADLAEALGWVKTDAERFLKDLLRGVSMWGTTAAMALVLALVWLALGQAVVTYAHPYGSPPLVLDILYLSYVMVVVSASLGVVLFWRYLSLRRRYARLFDIAAKLR